MKTIQESLFDLKEFEDREIQENKEIFDNILENIINSNYKINMDIIIDQMPKKNINILLEYITQELKQKTHLISIKEYDDTNPRNYYNTIIVIKDFNLFEDEILDSYRYKQKIAEFFEGTRKNDNIIIFTNPTKLEEKFKNIKKEIFDCNTCIHLKGKKNKKEYYGELIEKYKENNIQHKLSYNTFKNILEYIDVESINEYPVEFMYNYSIKRLIAENKKEITNQTFNNLIPKKTTKEKKESKENLENLIGLNNIKEQLNTLYNYLEFSKKIKSSDIYLNLFFLGNPGTGKTTVARIYKDKLYKLGYIKENKIIEITPNDLTGEYVGQTKEHAKEILEKAKNGLLFIDEAYQLYTISYEKGNNPYMDEAIVELLKYLEDPKNIVIFAGYTEEMKKIYKANPGIKSRIYKEIIFEDYSEEELYKILEQELNKKNLTIKKTSKQKIINHIKTIKQQKDFGNARTMKQLSQTMIMNHANKSKTLILDETDLPKIENEKTRMGFDIYGR